MAKLLVALSGGVDSAVAALLLQQAGHRVEAVYMRTWMDEEGSGILADCPWREDIESARAVAAHLNMPFEVLNMIESYREKVVSYLVSGYRSGSTPNPDIMCNREIKFGLLREIAQERGYDGLATGHYCRLKRGDSDAPELWQAKDNLKDQSYFLAMVRRPLLRGVHFPIGDYTKSDVRNIARHHNLPNAHRKDSQGICFLGRVPISEFLRQYIPDNPGEIINHRNEVVGQHRGLHYYTIGQRKGIGIPSNTDFEHYVVVKKDVATNRLHIAFDRGDSAGLWHQTATLTAINPLGKLPQVSSNLLVRPRYRDPAFTATYTPSESESASITFEQPQRALAIGQIAALYQGSQLIGGGVFSEIDPA